MEVKIIFNDGTHMSAEQNGNCFIVAAQPVFPDDLSVVTVESEDQRQDFNNVTIQECASIDGRFWFTFIEKGENDILREQIAALNADLTNTQLALCDVYEMIGG